jgi:NDP-sugar pyrophosphorylase family protein
MDRSGSADEPFILHNVDVVSSIDLLSMAQFHADHQALGTLAAQDRETSRYLLFDEHLELCGRRIGRDQQNEIVRQSALLAPLAFCGIHIISPRIFSLITETGAFPIINTYLRLAAAGEKLMAFRADQYYWRDLGKPEQVRQAAEDLKSGVLR